ncbi:N-acetylneuraminate lyase B-like [Oscarella lobularis]|uniref:N-acetylneuraminate lyase B-like n=1 Tax=Oscarella lobularis TaxID=121494 RepID=UPI003313244F
MRKRRTIGSAEAKAAKKNREDVDASVATMSHAELRTRLEELGDKPGPIDDSNRNLYNRMLTKKLATVAESSQREEKEEEVETKETPAVTSKERGGKKSKEGVSQKGKTAQQKVKKLGIEGVVAASYTPFNTDGSLNLAMVEPYANYLIRLGVAGVFVNGTTGEGVLMTVDERKAMVEAWAKAVKKRVKVIVHVSSTSLKDCQEMARHASSLDGVDAIAAMPPLVFSAKTIEELLVHLECIASSAPRTPLLLYHHSDMSPLNFSIEEFLRQADKRLPTFVGVKYTDYNVDVFARCLNLGRYEMLYGRDEQLLASLAMGAVSCVGSTYNFTGSIPAKIFAAFKSGDIATAQKEQLKSQLAIKTYNDVGRRIGCASPHALGKAIMHMIGCPVGAPRLPSKPLTDAQYKELKRSFEEIGFFDWHQAS